MGAEFQLGYGIFRASMADAATVRRWWTLAACLLATGCSIAAPRAPVRFAGDSALSASLGLGPCDPSRGELVLDRDRPLTVLVHGCNFSNGRFRMLSEVFEAHGQQTVCFNYDDRDSLEDSSRDLRTALESLASHLRRREVVILGHSQGGLVARHALVRERKDGAFRAAGVNLRLVTISSPFGGIKASGDCGSFALRLLTLGLTVAICQIATGSKWNEIHPSADFIRSPGSLVEPVSVHLKVVTDERGACLERDARGHCSKQDFVFGLDEQRNATLEAEQRMSGQELRAGHSEVVGQQGNAPWKLIHLLQAQGVLNETPVAMRPAMTRFVDALFAAPPADAARSVACGHGTAKCNLAVSSVPAPSN